jgi:hypothetical protein
MLDRNNATVDRGFFVKKTKSESWTYPPPVVAATAQTGAMPAAQMLAENNRIRAAHRQPPQTLDPRLCTAILRQRSMLCPAFLRAAAVSAARAIRKGAVDGEVSQKAGCH